MSNLKNDEWIRRMAIDHGMIEPSSETLVRTDPQGQKVISYGLSSLLPPKPASNAIIPLPRG
jgi:hypothetical protein